MSGAQGRRLCGLLFGAKSRRGDRPRDGGPDGIPHQKEGAAVCVCRAWKPVCGHELEDKFSAKFKQTRPVIAGNGAEVAVVGAVIQVLEFSVVERVE